MYVPAHFALDEDTCLGLLAQMGAADLVTGAGGLAATYLPLDLVRAGERLPDGGAATGLGSIVGHLARNNPQADALAGEGLVVLHAGDHYVSPVDLPLARPGRHVVPTWDYVTVHAYGELVRHDDPEWLAASMSALTDRHEAVWAGPDGETWSTAEADPGYLQRMIRAVVGVELRLTRLVGKAKFSQNKAPEDVLGEIAALRERGLDDLARRKEEISLPAARARAALLADVSREHGRRAR